MTLAAAAILAAGLTIDIDLTALFRRTREVRPANTKEPVAVCGIRIVGYHFLGQPGQTFGYAGESYTIPRSGYVELIADPRIKHYTFNDTELLLDGNGLLLDGFSFQWIRLPATGKGEMNP